MTDAREAAADALALHATQQVSRGYVLCRCDEEWDSTDSQARHQADAVLAAVEPLIRAQVLREAWNAVHVQRFAAYEGNHRSPDSFYAGVVRAENALRSLGAPIDTSPAAPGPLTRQDPA